jgi:hypothetical protein
VITVTLTFKTLSDALRALREVPESTLGADAEIAQEAPAPAPKSRKAAKPTPAPESEAAPAPATVLPPPVVPVPAAVVEAPPAFEYAVLQKKAFELLPRVGKAQILAVAEKHGAATFKSLPAEKWQAAYDDLVALED